MEMRDICSICDITGTERSSGVLSCLHVARTSNRYVVCMCDRVQWVDYEICGQRKGSHVACNCPSHSVNILLVWHLGTRWVYSNGLGRYRIIRRQTRRKVETRRDVNRIVTGGTCWRWRICNDSEASMGYNIANWEMIRTREELVEKLGLDGADDTHTLLNNMVDVRACYKPSGKVRF